MWGRSSDAAKEKDRHQLLAKVDSNYRFDAPLNERLVELVRIKMGINPDSAKEEVYDWILARDYSPEVQAFAKELKKPLNAQGLYEATSRALGTAVPGYVVDGNPVENFAELRSAAKGWSPAQRDALVAIEAVEDVTPLGELATYLSAGPEMVPGLAKAGTVEAALATAGDGLSTLNRAQANAFGAAIGRRQAVGGAEPQPPTPWQLKLFSKLSPDQLEGFLRRSKTAGFRLLAAAPQAFDYKPTLRRLLRDDLTPDSQVDTLHFLGREEAPQAELAEALKPEVLALMKGKLPMLRMLAGSVAKNRGWITEAEWDRIFDEGAGGF